MTRRQGKNTTGIENDGFYERLVRTNRGDKYLFIAFNAGGNPKRGGNPVAWVVRHYCVTGHRGINTYADLSVMFERDIINPFNCGGDSRIYRTLAEAKKGMAGQIRELKEFLDVQKS